VSWDRPFDQPVPLPSGRPARTLRDAADYIKKLPKSEHDSPEWRLAIHMLIDAAEDRGPMLFARMGILRATERSLIRRGKKRAGDRASSNGADEQSVAYDRWPLRRRLDHRRIP
jgi:hypothetical protein